MNDDARIECPHCQGEGGRCAPCKGQGWKLCDLCAKRPATDVADAHFAGGTALCATCMPVADSEMCFRCGTGKPVTVLDGEPACDRCLESAATARPTVRAPELVQAEVDGVPAQIVANDTMPVPDRGERQWVCRCGHKETTYDEGYGRIWDVQCGCGRHMREIADGVFWGTTLPAPDGWVVDHYTKKLRKLAERRVG